jgi:hypothetical protein
VPEGIVNFENNKNLRGLPISSEHVPKSIGHGSATRGSWITSRNIFERIAPVTKQRSKLFAISLKSLKCFLAAREEVPLPLKLYLTIILIASSKS